MSLLWDLVHWLFAMAVMIGLSSYFSASEAALFCLRWQDRQRLAGGNRAQRTASRLLESPDRLLSGVLFCNLTVNIGYFATASAAGLRMKQAAGDRELPVLIFTLGSILALIFFGELLPKSLAVLRPALVASWVSVPLAGFVRLVDPVMPLLRTVNLLSRRLLWPAFTAEPYLEIVDLERAIELSTSDTQLVKQEKKVLQAIVTLSDIRAEEWMRPRSQFRTYRAPVSLKQLQSQMTTDDLLLVIEDDQHEVLAAIDLRNVWRPREDQWELEAEPVLYAPWCASVADVLQMLVGHQRETAAIVNELGETRGLLTRADILETVFSDRDGRSERFLNRDAFRPLSDQRWQITSLTTLRRLAREFDVELPATRNVTVGGVVQEVLGRSPEIGDTCEWGPFQFRVTECDESGNQILQLQQLGPEDTPP